MPDRFVFVPGPRTQMRTSSRRRARVMVSPWGKKHRFVHQQKKALTEGGVSSLGAEQPF